MSISMDFLPDVEVVCPLSMAKRYQHQVLFVTYKGCNITEVLALSIDEATLLFEQEKEILKKLKVFQDVGPGYISLG